MELIGQILGIISFFVAFLLYQMKDRKSLMYMQSLLAVIVAAHYFFLGAYPAMAMNLFCLVRNGVYFRNDIFKSRYWPLIMSVGMLITGILTASGAWSVLVIAGLVINTYCLSFVNPQHFRLSIFISSPLILLYNITVFSIGGILLEGISVVSAAIGYIRFAKKDRIRRS